MCMQADAIRRYVAIIFPPHFKANGPKRQPETVAARQRLAETFGKSYNKAKENKILLGIITFLNFLNHFTFTIYRFDKSIVFITNKHQHHSN